MKAVVIHGAKDLRLEERTRPEPGPGMVELRLAYAGICGSDLHYYHQGRVGDALLREPMVLGHELSGIVEKLGPGVAEAFPRLHEGMRVVVNPSHECRECEYCRSGRQNLCGSLRYFGSAARTPHVQGIMQEYPLVQARHCIPVSARLPLDQAACTEPLAIALHAVSRLNAQNGLGILGKRVFISGAGPVGALIASVARLAGALEVCISDLHDYPLQIASALGADKTVLAADVEAMKELDNAYECSFEASGSLPGMQSALRATAPGGQLVHVGFMPANEVPYAVNTMILRKEVSTHGTLRAYQEFGMAAALLESGRLNASPLISAVYPLDKAEEAILHATDKKRAMKVLLKGPAA